MNLNHWEYDEDSKRWMFHAYLENCEVYKAPSGWVVECDSLGQIDPYETLDEAKSFVETYIYEGYCSLTPWAKHYQKKREKLKEDVQK